MKIIIIYTWFPTFFGTNGKNIRNEQVEGIDHLFHICTCDRYSMCRSPYWNLDISRYG